MNHDTSGLYFQRYKNIAAHDPIASLSITCAKSDIETLHDAVFSNEYDILVRIYNKMDV